jgi:hypothetical protein
MAGSYGMRTWHSVNALLHDLSILLGDTNAFERGSCWQLAISGSYVKRQAEIVEVLHGNA